MKKTSRKNLNQKQLKNLLFTTVTLFGFIVFQNSNRQIFKFLNFRLKISDFRGVLMKLLIL